MSKNKETITEGLGIGDDKYFDLTRERVTKKLESLKTLSDVLEQVAEEVRDEEFGESNFRISQYEKKLMLSGFMVGCVRAEAKMDELKMLLEMLMLAKSLGKNEKGEDVFGGVINGGDMPKELRDLLSKLQGDEKEDED